MSEGDAANQTVRKFVRDTAAERKKQLDLDKKYVFTSPSGLRFVAQLIFECGLYAANPDMGKRSVALGLRAAALKCGESVWHDIEKEIIAKRIDPTNAPKEIEDE